MSLDWNIKEVRDRKDLFHTFKTKTRPNGEVEETDDIETPRKDKLGMFLDTLIWACMSVDLRGIEEKNIEEWMFRLQVLEMTKDKIPSDPRFRITRGVLRRFIGLHTNVYTTTRRAFMAKIAKYLEREAEHAILPGKPWPALKGDTV